VYFYKNFYLKDGDYGKQSQIWSLSWLILDVNGACLVYQNLFLVFVSGQSISNYF